MLHCISLHSFMVGPRRHFHSFLLSLTHQIWPNTAATTTLLRFSAWPDACALDQVPWVGVLFLFVNAMMSVHSKVVCLSVFAHTILPKNTC